MKSQITDTGCTGCRRVYTVEKTGVNVNFRRTQHTTRYIVQGSPSGCVRREIPGVTQVDEKGHEGNTAAVVTGYICWRKHGVYIS